MLTVARSSDRRQGNSLKLQMRWASVKLTGFPPHPARRKGPLPVSRIGLRTFGEVTLRTGHRDPVSVAPFGATSRTVRGRSGGVKSGAAVASPTARDGAFAQVRGRVRVRWT
jgi:hypothetical protein